MACDDAPVASVGRFCVGYFTEYLSEVSPVDAFQWILSRRCSPVVSSVASSGLIPMGSFHWISRGFLPTDPLANSQLHVLEFQVNSLLNFLRVIPSEELQSRFWTCDRMNFKQASMLETFESVFQSFSCWLFMHS